jgi:hypothetical protein
MLTLPFKLTTVAHCADTRGKYEHTAQITADRFGGGPGLKIDDTAGSWCLKTLMEADLKNGIYIDFGQRWICTNIAALVDEALRIIASDFIASHTVPR